jgi:subtilase family serine protease
LLSTALPRHSPVPNTTLKSVGLSSPIAIHHAPNHGASGTRSHNSVTSDTSGGSTPDGGLTPQQMRGAYGVASLNFNGITGDGSGETIAILDPGDDTGLVNSTSSSFSSSDLAIFDRYYGLPDPPSFTKEGFTDPTTGSPQLTTNLPAAGTGDDEISLDVEWAHVMAPKANILLVEGSPDFSDIFNGVLAVDNAPASMHVCALSMSFGGSESGTLSSTANAEGVDGYYFDNAGLAYVASAGDSGAYGTGNSTSTITSQYPAASSNVLAVGGTTLNVSGNSYSSETTWGNGTSSGTNGGGGGGFSIYEPQPPYQVGKVNGLTTTSRAYPDISLEANPNTGVSIYDSPDYGTGTGWFPASLGGIVGGTSLSSPLMAGLIADADQGRALKGLAPLNSSGGSVTASNPNGNSSALDVHTLLYGLGYSNSDFHDVTSGSSIGPTSYGPKTGYDLSTGIGSPVANNLVVDLSGTSATPAVNLPKVTNLYVKQSSATQLSLWVNSATPGSGTASATYLLADASGINYIGGAGNDTLTLDYSNGNFASSFSNEIPATISVNPSPTAPPIEYVGAGTSNTIAFVGTTGSDTLTATASTITPSGGVGSTPVSVSNVQAIQFLGGSGGSDTFNVTGSPASGYTVNADTATGTPNVAVNVSNTGTAVNFAATQHLAALSIGADSRVALVASATAAAKVLVTSSLSITGTGVDMGVLDLTNNAAIINYATGSPLSAVQALIEDGRNSGVWTGKGITSSNAAADRAAHGLETTAVGYADNASLLIPYNQFAGQPVGRNAVLLRYTVMGDADLNGVVNDDDVGILNLYYDDGATTGHDWQQGDFNFDGKVNDDDAGILGLFYGSTVPGYNGV